MASTTVACPKFLRLNHNLTINSLLIYMFCTSCESEIVLSVLQIKCKWTKNSPNRSSNFDLIEETMYLSRIPSSVSDLKILKICFEMFLPVGNPVKWFELLNAWSDAEWRLTLPLRPSSPYRSNVALQEHATGKGFSFGLEIYFLALLFVVKKGRKYLGESVICTPNRVPKNWRQNLDKLELLA